MHTVGTVLVWGDLWATLETTFRLTGRREVVVYEAQMDTTALRLYRPGGFRVQLEWWERSREGTWRLASIQSQEVGDG